MAERLAMITVRVDQNLKTAFEQIGEELDLTTSQMLRQHIKRVVEQHAAAKSAQGALDLAPKSPPSQTTKKPAKGQKMASVKPNNWRG